MFQIDHIVATGSYATVVVALDNQGEHIALKVLRGELVAQPENIDRMYDEAVMLSRLRHPNILRVDEVLHVRGRPIIVMEWVRGVSLDRILRGPEGQLPLRISVEVCRQVALALAGAYAAPGADGQPMHIVHRDIKPSNILLSVDGQVKLADFGVAKGEYAERQTDSLYMVHGSLSFTAPERLEGVADGPSGDVYALGLSLFELATGKQMILARSQERHDKALDEYLERLGDAETEQGTAELRALLRQMAMHDRTQRLSAQEVADGLGAWLDATGGSPHLDAWAWERVTPLFRDQMTPPRLHSSFADVAFLDELTREQVTQEARRVEQRTAEELDVWVEQLVASSATWWERLPELKRALRNRSDWSMRPFLDVLHRAKPRWYKPWVTPASEDAVAASLDVLRHRQEPEVLKLARSLSSHPAEQVAGAAQRVVRRADRVTT